MFKHVRRYFVAPAEPAWDLNKSAITFSLHIRNKAFFVVTHSHK